MCAECSIMICSMVRQELQESPRDTVEITKMSWEVRMRKNMEYLKGQQEQEAIQWMNKAAEIAEKALCLLAKCGTVIVKDGEIVGEGYNAPPLDKKENQMCDQEIGVGKEKYDRTCCMHAEWRAITDALKRNSVKFRGSKLFSAGADGVGRIKKWGKPYCTVCSRMALDAGIEKFVLWHDDGICEYPADEYDRLSYQYVPA